MEPAPVPAWGTPLRDLGEIEYMVRELPRPDLLMASGVSTNVAHMVAAETGDRIAWPIATHGFLDGTGGTLAVVVHFAGNDRDAALSGVNYGMPWSRRILRLLAAELFVAIELDSLTMRVRLGDEALARFLLRLGFAACGRDDRLGAAARHVFVIDRTTALRRAWPRAFSRRGC